MAITWYLGVLCLLVLGAWHPRYAALYLIACICSQDVIYNVFDLIYGLLYTAVEILSRGDMWCALLVALCRTKCANLIPRVHCGQSSPPLPHHSLCPVLWAPLHPIAAPVCVCVVRAWCTGAKPRLAHPLGSTIRLAGRSPVFMKEWLRREHMYMLPTSTTYLQRQSGAGCTGQSDVPLPQSNPCTCRQIASTAEWNHHTLPFVNPVQKRRVDRPSDGSEQTIIGQATTCPRCAVVMDRLKLTSTP